MRAGEVKHRGKVFGLQYTAYSIQYNKGLRRTEGGDQADIFNLIQNSQNTSSSSVHLKVLIDEEQWRIAQGSKGQAGGCGTHVRNLSGLRHPDTPHHAQ